MTTKVTISLYGDVERAVKMWASLTGAPIEDIVATAVFDQTDAWDKKLPQSIRELRELNQEELVD